MKASDTSLLSDLKIAVCHGNYVGRGGGERVAEEIARTFDAPLYYGFGDEENEPDDIECHSLFNDLFGADLIQRSFTLRDAYYMYGWRSVPELLDYDVLIQSGNEPGWYKPPEDQVIVKYTHSTPRNAYDRYPYRAPENGLIYDGYTFATEQLYQSVTSYPDTYVANSEVVKRRIDKYWGVNGDNVCVVYPPVPVGDLGPDHATDSHVDGEFYLVLDRLVPTKHVNDIVEAFRAYPNKQLIVAGHGSEKATLEEQASDLDNVSFAGYVSEADKRALLAGAKALVYAAEDEDFGIVPIEALASGTPVIGPAEGFTKYQISDGKTGILYERGPGAIADAIGQFETGGVSASTATLQAVAEQYSVQRFRRELRQAVEDALGRARIEADVAEPPVLETIASEEPVIASGVARE